MNILVYNIDAVLAVCLFTHLAEDINSWAWSRNIDEESIKLLVNFKVANSILHVQHWEDKWIKLTQEIN